MKGIYSGNVMCIYPYPFFTSQTTVDFEKFGLGRSILIAVRQNSFCFMHYIYYVHEVRLTVIRFTKYD
jgi:hypothetical protein